LANDNKVHRRGEFQLKGKQPEEAAWEFWKWIKREHPWEVELEKVLCEGENITEEVKKLEQI
jgi:hypothetical protein